jgi:RNA polymerase sigma-70 factor (ECF subfamily)
LQKFAQFAQIRLRQRESGMRTSKVTVHPSAVRAPATAGRQAELALVERCRRSDLGAFEELYRTHAGRLYSVALRLVRNPADAEDLLQEIFLAAHRKLDTFRGESALGTWLFRLASNLCLDHLRSRTGRSRQVTDSIDDEQGLFDIASSTLAAQTVTKMDLERALARLPEGCRAAFVLHDVEGLEHREVAQILGVAEGTSKSQVHKARLKLRAILGNQEEGGRR